MPLNGWAIESRVYAEDPKLFLPSIGRLRRYIEPKTGVEGDQGEIRCDSGIREGSEISMYYDPLICKLSTHGKTREEAIDRMTRALDSYVIRGVTHNIPILREIMSQKRFQDGALTTKYLPEEFPNGFEAHKLSEKEHKALACAALVLYRQQQERVGLPPPSGAHFVSIKGYDDLEADLKDGDVFVAGLKTYSRATMRPESPLLDVSVHGKPYVMQWVESPHVGKLKLQAFGTVYEVSVMTPLEREVSKHLKSKKAAESSNIHVKAPMAGQVISVAVKVGDVLKEGTEIAVIEAMKMQNVIRSTHVGKVTAVKIEEGKNVQADAVIIEMQDLN